jgi:hypothetical protein
LEVGSQESEVARQKMKDDKDYKRSALSIQKEEEYCKEDK